ncbi:MAG: methyltransferase domain-containing protein [Deltaproteobacteria bacterium]|nr:methyltransferase domain-containing protein [Deltaproteobacteria bacterium]MBW2018611.1 methyltransferase domain-containing protein [Deltaproteobacteria bacterium]MBW2073877.1 methyltransferase domain-containing protein [Deltaproteobacteria bacterium]
MTKDTEIKSNDYHDYVIKDGKFIGKFEEMYKKCENPWPETEEALEFSPVSSRTPVIINAYGHKKIFSVGSGKGMHLNWLKKQCPHINVSGCEISPTAVKYCREMYPDIQVCALDVRDFPKHTFDFDLLLLREVVWYILDCWHSFCAHLKKEYKGKNIIVELSFYDNQSYGNEFFNGPEEFVEKFPFEIIEVVRHHVTRKQREGMLFLYGRI